MKKIIASIILRILGWKVDPVFPKEARRSVMLAAPHTSNWDFFYVILAFWKLGIPMKVAIKEEWTKFPFGLIIKPLGGLGIRRGPKKEKDRGVSQVDQMVTFFDKLDEIALVIAPEGTRSLRKHWKMGFYHIATKAEVPITLGYLDYPTKTAGVAQVVVYPTGDQAADMKKILSFYSTITGATPENFTLDQRYID